MAEANEEQITEKELEQIYGNNLEIAKKVSNILTPNKKDKTLCTKCHKGPFTSRGMTRHQRSNRCTHIDTDSDSETSPIDIYDETDHDYYEAPTLAKITHSKNSPKPKLPTALGNSEKKPPDPHTPPPPLPPPREEVNQTNDILIHLEPDPPNTLQEEQSQAHTSSLDQAHHLNLNDQTILNDTQGGTPMVNEDIERHELLLQRFNALLDFSPDDVTIEHTDIISGNTNSPTVTDRIISTNVEKQKHLLDSMQNKIDQQYHNISELMGKIDSLENDRENSKQEISYLDAQLKDKICQITELTILIKRFEGEEFGKITETYKSKIITLELSNAELKSELSSTVKKLADQSKSLGKTNEELQSKLESSIDTLQSKLQNLQQTNNSLKIKLRTSNVTLEKTVALLKKNAEKYGQLCIQFQTHKLGGDNSQSIKNIYAQIQNKLKNSEEKVLHLNSLVDFYRDRYVLFQSLIKEHENKNKTIVDDLTTLQLHSSTLEKENKALGHEKETLTKQIKTLNDSTNNSIHDTNESVSLDRLEAILRTICNKQDTKPISSTPNNKTPKSHRSHKMIPTKHKTSVKPNIAINSGSDDDSDNDDNDDIADYESDHGRIRNHYPYYSANFIPNKSHRNQSNLNTTNNPRNYQPYDINLFAGLQLAALNNSSNITVLGQDGLYDDNIRSAVALSKWVTSIEAATPDNNLRAQLAVQKLDSEILDRIRGTNGDVHNIPWDTLISKLYRMVTPSSFDVALARLYKMEYSGNGHPATFFSLLCRYRGTMEAMFPSQKQIIPSLKSVIRKCLLGKLSKAYKGVLGSHLMTCQTPEDLDDFLGKFARIYNEEPRNVLFVDKNTDYINTLTDSPSSRNWDWHNTGFSPTNTTHTQSPFPYQGGSYPQTHVPYPQNNSWQHQTPQHNNLPSNTQHTNDSHQIWQKSHIKPSPNFSNHRIQTRPWDLWQPWDCQCGERNNKNRATCTKCEVVCPEQPTDCHVCTCGRRVFIHSKKCPYCKSDSPTITEQ